MILKVNQKYFAFKKSKWLIAAIFVFLIAFCIIVAAKLPFIKQINFHTDLFNRVIPQTPKFCTTKKEIEFYYYGDGERLWQKNNKYGLYVYAENKDYFEIAQNLVNSNGGEWGYVLIPYNIKDRDYSKWETVFEMLRNKKLIPVVQLHAIDLSDYQKDTKKAADFLNTFLWPVRDRYISVYNEPNDAAFWNGKVDPVEYAEVLNYTIDIFKAENSDFFIMNGAFNTSAPNGNTYMDAFDYMKRMDEAVPGIFKRLDGWASHPYPQPNFSGSPSATGRWSIRAYEDELSYLNEKFGVSSQIPVFITETGWAHAEGENYSGQYYSVETIGKYFKQAFENVWLKDDRVRAVIIFTVWYEPPYDHFSIVNRDRVPYKHYDLIKSLKKINGDPPSLKKKTITIQNC